MEFVDTVIIGGGQAGLAMSYYLKEMGREHLILERERVAERWRTERWDSLMFQFPNWNISLPGQRYRGNNLDSFSHKDAILRFIEDYAIMIQAPLRSHTNVISLRATKKCRYLIATNRGDVEALNVVIATGPYQRPMTPQLSRTLQANLHQMHVSRYRNPSALPDGAVLIVGSGASGCQVADELLESGRRVYLSVGQHQRLPRRYRGRDVTWWLTALGRYDAPVDELPEWLRGEHFLFTGVHGGYDIDLRRSASRGMVLLGHLTGVRNGHLHFKPDLDESLRKGDETFREFTLAADAYAEKRGLDAPICSYGGEATRGEEPRAVKQTEISLEGITSIIWATGYSLDFSWINLPIINAHGEPVHKCGVTDLPGVYFLGLKRQRNAKSSLLPGVGEDAAYLADHLGTSGG